jgi:hypothetical protein
VPSEHSQWCGSSLWLDEKPEAYEMAKQGYLPGKILKDRTLCKNQSSNQQCYHDHAFGYQSTCVNQVENVLFHYFFPAPLSFFLAFVKVERLQTVCFSCTGAICSQVGVISSQIVWSLPLSNQSKISVVHFRI